MNPDSKIPTKIFDTMRDANRTLLVSQEPVAYGKNALIQKELDSKFRLLVKEYKIAQRKTRATAEQCVTSIYSMLIEAERFAEDKQNRNEDNNKARQCRFQENQNIQNVQKDKITSSIPRTRPMSATAHFSKQTKRKESERPKSAHPVLSQDRVGDVIAVDNDEDDIEYPEDAQRDSLQRSNSTKMPMNSINAKIMQLRLLALKNKSGKKAKMDELKKQSSKDSDDSEFEVEEDEDEEKTSSSEGLNSVVRPRTADFYRKKQPEDERGEYWNKRVNILIRKWDIEDKGDDLIDRRHHHSKYIDKGPPPLMNINKNATEATLRKNAFVRKYCGTYRSLLRPSSAPVESHHKRSEKITRQELASIHADTAKRRKNTKAILRKSRKLRMQIESLTLVQEGE